MTPALSSAVVGSDDGGCCSTAAVVAGCCAVPARSCQTGVDDGASVRVGAGPASGEADGRAAAAAGGAGADEEANCVPAGVDSTRRGNEADAGRMTTR